MKKEVMTIGNIEFEVIGNTLRRIRYVGTSEHEDVDNLIIPSSINGSQITCIEYEILNSIFIRSVHVNKLVIPSGVTEIGEAAFSHLNADEVVWASTCPKISQDCFRFSKIKTISNIQNVEKVEDGAFSFCGNLECIVWPDNCSIIPRICFFYCKSLNSFSFKNITTIKSAAFYSTGLKKVVETSTIQEIGTSAFAECKFLKDFSWPDNCSIIPVECFQYSNIERISNLRNVKKILKFAFYGAPLKSIDLRETLINNQEVYIDDNAFNDINKITFIT